MKTLKMIGSLVLALSISQGALAAQPAVSAAQTNFDIRFEGRKANQKSRIETWKSLGRISQEEADALRAEGEAIATDYWAARAAAGNNMSQEEAQVFEDRIDARSDEITAAVKSIEVVEGNADDVAFLNTVSAVGNPSSEQ